MTKAMIVVFHKYPGMVSDNYLILFEYFQKCLWKWEKEIDRLYLISSNGFLPPLIDLPIIKTVTIPTQNLSHAKNLELAFSKIEEELVCLIDQDTVIYGKNILSDHFSTLETHDVASFVERAGNKVSRFAPYFFMCKRSALPQNPNFSEDPEKGLLDPLSILTKQMIENGCNYQELTDDRSTIQLAKDGTILKNPSDPLKTGIYHIRNFYGALSIVEDCKNDKESFRRRIDPMPPEELTRLFGWLWLLNKKTRSNDQLNWTMVEILSNHLGIALSDWQDYMEEFAKYHSYI